MYYIPQLNIADSGFEIKEGKIYSSMLKNLNPEILAYDSKYVYTMKSKQKKIPQFKKKDTNKLNEENKVDSKNEELDK